MRKVAVAVTCLITCVTFVAAQSFAQLSGRYRYETQFLNEGIATSADTKSERHDIVMMGDVITIREPLLTFGGDVILVGNTIRLLAPIDTRPYVPIRKVYWGATPHGTARHFGSILYDNPSTASAFDGYFHWTQKYDPGTRRFIFHVPIIPSIDERLRGATFSIWSSSAPSPIITEGTIWSNGVINGVDAPPVIQDSLKSGNILIVANRIETCGNPCEPLIHSQSHPEAGDFGDVEGSLLLVTEGLKGGYGSPSPSHACGPLRGPCDSAEAGFSGKPGKGHDAGNVDLYLLGRWSVDIGLTSLLEFISVRGGNPPYIKPLHTPSHSTFSQVPNRSGFVREDKPSELPPEDMLGKRGVISVNTQATAFEVMSALASRLSLVAIDREYDVAALLENQISDQLYLTSEPRGLLKEYLRLELNKLHKALLSNFAAYLVSTGSNPAFSKAEEVVPLFSQMNDCNASLYHSFDQVELEFVRAICRDLKVLDKPEFYWLALSAGGVMRKVPTDLKVSIELSSIAAEIASVNAEVAAAVTELKKLGISVRAILDQQERFRLLDKLELVKEKLAAAQAKYEGAKSRFPNIGEWIQLGSDLAGFGGALKDAGEALRNVGLKEAGEIVKKHKGEADGIGKFVKTLLGSDSSMDEVRQLQMALENVLRDIAQFEQAVANERDSAIKRLGAQTKRTLDLYSRANAKQKRAALNFEDIFRGVLQSFLHSADRDISRFILNSKAASSLISDVRDPTLPLDLQDLRDVCSSQPPKPFPFTSILESQLVDPLGCVSIERHATDNQVLWYLLSPSKRLPLLVVAPGNGSVTVSLDWLSTRKELSLEAIPRASPIFK